ncbi:MAG: hypothetical protein ACM3Y8_05730, partial [Byssovorax cruenta]
MKYTVRIAGSTYEVEIEDIHARPVIAYVDGERFEVHPEDQTKPDTLNVAKDLLTQKMSKLAVSPSGDMNQLIAPLPGTIVDIFVKNGED